MIGDDWLIVTSVNKQCTLFQHFCNLKSARSCIWSQADICHHDCPSSLSSAIVMKLVLLYYCLHLSLTSFSVFLLPYLSRIFPHTANFSILSLFLVNMVNKFPLPVHFDEWLCNSTTSQYLIIYLFLNPWYSQRSPKYHITVSSVSSPFHYA